MDEWRQFLGLFLWAVFGGVVFAPLWLMIGIQRGMKLRALKDQETGR